MHVVVRHYKGKCAKLIDELVDRGKDVEALIRGVGDGFAAYYLVRRADGGASVSVFEDEAGTTRVEQARSRLHQGEPRGCGGGTAEIIEGTAVIDFK